MEKKQKSNVTNSGGDFTQNSNFGKCNVNGNEAGRRYTKMYPRLLNYYYVFL